MPAKHEHMRSANALLVLDHIRLHGESTRRSIQEATELSWAAVSNISASLISKSVLREVPCKEKMPGRVPDYLDFVPMRNLTIGMEITIEGVTLVLLDLRGNLIDYIMEPLFHIHRDQVLNQMISGVDKLMRQHNLSADAILGIGIATQGSVDRDGTTSLYNSFFTDWRDVPLKEIFEKRFGIPVRILHDPVCIALAEQWRRRFTEKNEFAVIRLSYGIGMCYIVHGEPIHGRDGIAGEMGHIVLDRNGPRCSCGNRGCMESYSSIRGICNRVREDYEAGLVTLPSYLQGENPMSVSYMLDLVRWCADLARKGDARMKGYFDDAAYYLGIGIANMVNLFNPECVVLTGKMLDFADLFIDKVRDVARSHSWELSEFEIMLTDAGKWQASIGAGLYFINDAFRSLNSPLLADASN